MKNIRRPFGNGPKVSLFTLGTMRAISSEEQMYKVLKASFAAGINHVETAPAYGPAENFLGKALNRLKSEGLEPKGGWVITSKLIPGLDLIEGKQKLRGILSRLGIKKIDNLAVHGINLSEHLDWAIKGKGADLLRWAQDEDLIGQVGFSSHGSLAIINEALESERFQFCSLHLHLLDQERIPLATNAISKGIGVMAISPADKGGHLQSPSQTLIKDCSPLKPLELAYRFLIAKGISTLTLGAFKPEDLTIAQRLRNNAGPLCKLEEETIEKLRRVREYRLGTTACGQCKKCLPCTKQVPIPSLLRLRNLLIGHDLEEFTKERYNLIGKAGHWWESVNATACEQCKDCLPRCPHHLKIPELLKETHELLACSPQRRLWD